MRKHQGKEKQSKLTWIITGIALLLVALTILAATINIACDLVAREAQDAVKTYLQADLKLEKVSGNPLRGYRIIGVELSKNGAEMVKADFVEAEINFMSLLSSPRLSLLSIGGVNVNLDKLIEELNKLPSQPSGQPFQVPIDELKLVQSVLSSEWGKLEVEDVSLGFEQYTITASVNAKVNELPVSGTITAEVNGANVDLKNTDLKIGKGSVKGSGKLSETLDVQGIIEGLDITEIVGLWPTLVPGDYVGAIGLSFKASGTWVDPVFTATANYKGERIAGWPVESFNGAVNYKEMRLSLDKITANALGIPLEGDLAMAFRNDVPSVYLKLKGGATDLASLSSLSGTSGVTGNISDFTVDISGPTNALSGAVALHAPEIGAYGVKGTEVALQVKLSGGNQATVNGKMKFQGAASFLSGSITDILTGPKLNVTLKTVDLNLAALKPLIPDADMVNPKGNATAEIHVKGSMSDPSIEGTINSKSITAMDYTADNLAVGFSYAGGNFTLKDSSASWTGLPINASGTVKNVMAEKPTLDINASLSLTPDSLAKFVPDIAQYKLKGTVQVGVRATGTLPEPKLDLVISSKELAAMDIINAKDIKATTALTGDLEKLDNVDLELSAQSVSASGLGFQNVSAQVKKQGDAINLVSAKASSGQGSISGSGNVTIPQSGAGNININVDMSQLNLSDLSKTGDLGVELAGTFSGKLALTGKTDMPSIAFQGNAPKFSVAGYGMDNLAVELNGNANNINLNNLSAQIGAGKLSASGTIKPGDGTGQIEFAGSGLDLARLTENVPDLKGQVAGMLSAKFNAAISAKGASGQGNATIPSLKAYGMQLTDVSIPLALTDTSFKFGQGTAKLNGGTLMLDGEVNTQTLKYSGKMNASGVDVNALVHDLVPDLGGKITGSGAMDVAFNGAIDPQFTLGGTGNAKIGSGSLSGFSYLDIVTKLHGTDSIRYTEVVAPFNLETTRIIFQKGSKATAPDNDPLYKYVQIEGPITYAGALNLTGDGNINFQLINIVAGGALGATGAIVGGNINELVSGKGLESLLTQTVTQGAEAGKSRDFRDVSFKIGGTYDSPSFSLGKVGESTTAPTDSSSETKEQPQTVRETVQEAVKDKVLDGLGISTAPKENASSEATATNETQQQGATSETKEQPQTVQETVKEVVKDKVLDSLGIKEEASSSGADATGEPQQQQQQAEPSDKKETPKKPEDIVKEEAGKALKNILKRN